MGQRSKCRYKWVGPLAHLPICIVKMFNFSVPDPFEPIPKLMIRSIARIEILFFEQQLHKTFQVFFPHFKIMLTWLLDVSMFNVLLGQILVCLLTNW